MASFESQLEAFRQAAIVKAERIMADPAELAAFLTARLDEDQAAGEHLLKWCEHPVPGRPADSFAACMTDAIIGPFNGRTQHTNIQTGMYVVHVAEPARILAEVAVKRERLRMYVQQRETLRDVYANPDKYTFDQQLAAAVAASVHEVLVRMDATVHERHPDFKAEWRLP